jgi:hypothetical protein
MVMRAIHRQTKLARKGLFAGDLKPVSVNTAMPASINTQATLVLKDKFVDLAHKFAFQVVMHGASHLHRVNIALKQRQSLEPDFKFLWRSSCRKRHANYSD